MVIDCLAAANRVLKFTDDLSDPDQYLLLDDSILSVRVLLVNSSRCS